MRGGKRSSASQRGISEERKTTFRSREGRIFPGRKICQYRDRKQRKRQFRSLWIIRINAAVREHGMVYSDFIDGLKTKNVELDRKSLAHLALHEPESAQETLVDLVKP